MAAPAVGPGVQRRTTPGGVEMEVPHEFDELGRSIAEDGLGTPLKEGAGFVIAPIVVLTIGERQRLHRARQEAVACFQYEMHMIGHEDVRMQRHAVAGAIAFEAVQIGGPVRVLVKERRAAGAPGDHMRERARELEARLARHRPEPDAPRRNTSILMPDPIFFDRTIASMGHTH